MCTLLDNLPTQGDQMVLLSLSDRICSRLLFLHAHREASTLVNEIPEESGQFRFLHAACLANLKGSLGLILAKTSAMRISIPLNLAHAGCLLKSFIGFSTHHSFNVTFFTLGFRHFFILLKINQTSSTRLHSFAFHSSRGICSD